MINFSFGTKYTYNVDCIAVQLQNMREPFYNILCMNLFFIPVFVVRTLDVTTGFDVIFYVLQIMNKNDQNYKSLPSIL